MSGWTAQDLMTVSSSRLLDDGKVVFAGVGLPVLAAMLARSLHAPTLTIALEGGIIGPDLAPGSLPISTNEMRGARRAQYLTDITDVFLLAQRGYFDYGFLGAAQVDPFGNINSSIIGDPDSPEVRLPGTGGANDIASLCSELVIVTTHERRRFVERVDFVTSPGNLDGGTSRRDAGLVFGGVSTVVTDLAIFDFKGEAGRMRLVGLQPGATMDQVADATGFPFESTDEVRAVAPPTEREIEILRLLDPAG